MVVEKVQHELLESPVKAHNFRAEDYHTYYVSGFGLLVHNKRKNVKKVALHYDSAKEGKNFLGEGYTKIGRGHCRSVDGYRTMRFDFSKKILWPALAFHALDERFFHGVP